jgi:hypothetical protein
VLSLAAGDAKLRPMRNINRSTLDWRTPARQIAQELGCSRQAVYLAQARRWGGLETVIKQVASAGCRATDEIQKWVK